MADDIGPKVPTLDGELAVSLPFDVDSLETFKSNLNIGALYFLKECPFPLRSRVKVVVSCPKDYSPAEIEAEVVFAQDGKVGLSVISLSKENEERLKVMLNDPQLPILTPPAPSAVPATQGRPSSAARAAPRRLSIPLEGKLAFSLPGTIKRIFDDAPGPDWEKKAKVLTGTLLGLVFELNRGLMSGRVVLNGKDGTKTLVYFNEGQIVGAVQTPVPETETVAYQMRRAGQIMEKDYREVREAREKEGKADVLLLRGRTADKLIAQTARKSIYKILGRCFACAETDYRIEPSPQFLSEILPIPVSTRRVFFRGLMEAAAVYLADELQAGLGPFLNLYIARAQAMPFDVGELRLSAQETRFFEVTLEKPVRLRNLFSISALSRVQTLRAVYAFFFTGFVDFLSDYTPTDEDFLPHLRQTVEETESMNHFEVLQVHWTALLPEIETAYKRVKASWQGLVVPPSFKAEAEPLIAKIIGLADSSFRFLSDSDRRRKHRSEIVEPIQQKFSAELLITHGRMELFRGDRKGAAYHLEQALDLVPGDREARRLMAEAGKKAK